MLKNEKIIYKQIHSMRNCLRKQNNRKTNINFFSKLHSNRKSFLEKSKTSSNFIRFKINSLYRPNDSKDNQNPFKKMQLNNTKEIFNNDIKLNIKSFTARRNNMVNTIQLDENYLRLISIKNIKNKRTSSMINDINKNNQLLHSVYTPIKKKRIDLIKYKFLLGKKNYYKRICNLKENGLLINEKSNNITPFHLYINYNIYNNEDDKTKYLQLQSEEIKSSRLTKENFSFPSIRNQGIQKQLKNFKFTSIKIKKDNDGDKNNISKITKYFNDKYIKYKDNFSSEKDNIKNNLKGDVENDKSSSHCKIIEDNYNEYLNDISSSEANKSKEDNKNMNKINYKKILEARINKRIKDLRKKMLIYEKNDIYKNIKGFKINENLIKMNKANKTLKIKKVPMKRKNSSQINKNINNDNDALTKKLLIHI